jgi:amphi-Trp domain-containing protein
MIEPQSLKNINPDQAGGLRLIPPEKGGMKLASNNLTNREETAMGRETVLFKTEEKKTAKEISETLRLIADKIDAGSMTLSQGADEVTVTFPGTMEIQLKVEEEQGKRLKKKFEVELEWIPGAGETEEGSTRIS